MSGRRRPRIRRLGAVPVSKLDGADQDALRIAAEAGIHRIPVPTPFAIGDVNLYLVEGDRLMLVDAGPNAATSLGALETGLRTLGRRIADLEVLFVTHQHIDHIGLAGEIARRSGAELVCLDLLAPVLEEWAVYSEQDDDDAFLLMSRHGVEPHVAEALHAVASVVRGWGAPASVDRTVFDGETLTVGDRTFVVGWRPGHSPSDTILHEPSTGILLAGDHLLKDISSNAVIARPMGEPLGPWPADRHRPTPLLQYRSSLRATWDLEVTVALGGHGGPVLGHRDLIDARLAGHARRAEEFLDLLRRAGRPLSAHEIATERWGEVAITQAFLTLSEVLGHLDMLIGDGAVDEDRSEHVVRFAPR